MLSNYVELMFSLDGTFLGIDDDTNDDFGDVVIIPSDLHNAILNYITTSYPVLIISHAELENNGNYEVQLSDAVVLVFDSTGNFIVTGVDENDIDNDHSDNETVINTSSLPQVVLSLYYYKLPI